MKKFLHLVLNMAAALSLFTLSTSAAAQIGSLSNDLVFTPVTPCRIMDTRNPGVKSGILVAGTTRNFWGWAGSFADQGGAATPCGTLGSTDEAAIVVNFTVVTPDAAGYITAFPFNASQPTAATVNFAAGAVVGNNATLKLSQTGSVDHFKVFSTSNVHLVADIVGYYAKPVATALECVDTAIATATLPASGGANVSSEACGAAFTITGGSCTGANFSAMLVSYIIISPTYFCAYHNSSAIATTIGARARCCRIPGR